MIPALPDDEARLVLLSPSVPCLEILYIEHHLFGRLLKIMKMDNIKITVFQSTNKKERSSWAFMRLPKPPIIDSRWVLSIIGA